MENKTPKFNVSIEPLLVDSAGAARLLNISRRYFLQLSEKGSCPQPIYLGKRRLWRISDLQRWVLQGCPSRKDFEDGKNI